jgi:hypothetical protein
VKTRRNPFETSESVAAVIPPPTIYDSLRVASPRKRNRQWEKKHQSHKAVYRGVDPKLALKVKTIAGDLVVPEGEVARAVIEFALRAYQEGELDLIPRLDPNRMRRTLFPTSTPTRLYEEPVRSRKRKPPEAIWRVITTWRGFPPELKRELATLASEDVLHVPVGELITALLRFGLKAYQYGLLNLKPVQKAAAFTLQIGDKK